MNSIISRFFIFVIIIIAISCNNNDAGVNNAEKTDSIFTIWSDTVVKIKYDDGSARQIWGFKPNDKEMHYEWSYYKNGNTWLEGPMYDTLRHGIWKGYSEQGSLIAQGTYRVGKATGIYTVWYENGKKFYEGDMKEGKRIGEWSFYNKEGELIKTIDYSKVQEQN